MSLSGNEELAIGGGFAVAGFVARWVWDRVWRRRDAATTAARTMVDEVALVAHRQDVAEARETERARALGILESRHNRLDGKVDGLQELWVGRFDKLEAEFKGLEDKVTHKLDNFRAELRADQQELKNDLARMQTEHQARMHNRLNEATAAQASALSELMDKLVDRIAEPRPSPTAPRTEPIT